MDIAILILCVLNFILLIVLLVKNKNQNQNLSSDEIDSIKRNVEEVVKTNLNLSNEKTDYKFNTQISLIESKNKEIINSLDLKISFLEKEINSFNAQVKERLQEFNATLKESFASLNSNVKENLQAIREDSSEKLEKINITVSEKLEKTLEGRLKQSFDNVVEQISSVNKAVGEIKGLASDVGSLKTVLTNVKTKGIVGEIILGNIIRDILTSNQYDENVATKKNSSERVEFAIKMPGANNDFVYLPIDSKLPLESYHKIKDGIDSGDLSLIETGRKSLRAAIRTYAKEIKDKYIDVPNTTDFAIMFLPIEGLYIEALDMGLFEEIQSEFKVNIAGPTTLTAILNSLQMGFKTLVIQKKSAEVFKLLGAVKTEFSKFAEVLQKTQKKVGEASDELDKLVGTRTRLIQSKLNNIDSLEDNEAKEILEKN